MTLPQVFPEHLQHGHEGQAPVHHAVHPPLLLQVDLRHQPDVVHWQGTMVPHQHPYYSEVTVS